MKVTLRNFEIHVRLALIMQGILGAIRRVKCSLMLRMSDQHELKRVFVK
jgi:hypothetical protein